MNFTNYHIAANQSGVAIKVKGEKFYVATRYFIEIGENATLILSSQPNGKGTVFVDDTLKLVGTDQNDSSVSATYKHDYSNGCDGTGIKHTAPIDLTQFDDFKSLRGKTISCEVQMHDKCGGVVSSSDIYLCVGE